VLAVHHRNGGNLSALNWHWRLLEPVLGIDSLDLAEIVAGVEKRFHIALFDLPNPPRTWEDVSLAVRDGRSGSSTLKQP